VTVVNVLTVALRERLSGRLEARKTLACSQLLLSWLGEVGRVLLGCELQRSSLDAGEVPLLDR
jgi:hypothetical protein